MGFHRTQGVAVSNAIMNTRADLIAVLLALSPSWRSCAKSTTGDQHSVNQGDTDGCFGLLTGRVSCTQSWSGDHFESSHDRFHPYSFSVIYGLFPADSALLNLYGNVLWSRIGLNLHRERYCSVVPQFFAKLLGE